MSASTEQIICNVCRIFVARTYGQLKDHQRRAQCIRQFLSSVPEGSQQASTASSAMEVDIQDIMDVDIDLDEVPVVHPADNNIDITGKFKKGTSNAYSFANISLVVNDSTHSDPIMYQHVTEENNMSIIQKFALAFHKIANQNVISREARRELSRCINTNLIEKLDASVVEGKFLDHTEYAPLTNSFIYKKTSVVLCLAQTQLKDG